MEQYGKVFLVEWELPNIERNSTYTYIKRFSTKKKKDYHAQLLYTHLGWRLASRIANLLNFLVTGKFFTYLD